MRISLCPRPALMIAICALSLTAQQNVTTYQYGNARTGWNPNETTLSPGNVSAANFGKLFYWGVDGYHLRPAFVRE